jgi:hypothetical protein
MKITGIDLAKTNFYPFSINTYGKPAGKIKLSRSNLLNWLVQQPPVTIATRTVYVPAPCTPIPADLTKSVIVPLPPAQ